MLPPGPETRSFATVYCSAFPPCVFAAISCSFFTASMPAACAARVCACVVWLPPETQLHGRFCPVLPHVTTTFSHGTPSISAATRCVSLNDSVPRLPMPDWMYILPYGLITNSPSTPTEPETNTLDESL